MAKALTPIHMTTSNESVIKKLLLVFLVFAGLYFAKEFLMPLAIGGILATLFLPFCKWLEGKSIPKGLAAFICVLLLLLGFAGVGALLGFQISALAKDWDTIQHQAAIAWKSVQEYIFTNLCISAEQQMEIITNQQSALNGITMTIAGSLAYVFTSFILLITYLFLFLYYRTHIKDFLLKLSPPEQRTEMQKVVYSAANVSQQYLLGLAKMIGCLWIMYSIGFSIVGVEHAFFFAVLCGLLEIIPFVGNITGTSITVLVAAAQGGSAPMLASIVLTYGIVQLIQGWILEPLIVGPQVQINPFATVIALVLGELVWGIPGIILAIPITAMLKIACDHIPPLKPYGFLIGELDTSTEKTDLVEQLKTRLALLLHKKKPVRKKAVKHT